MTISRERAGEVIIKRHVRELMEQFIIVKTTKLPLRLKI